MFGLTLLVVTAGTVDGATAAANAAPLWPLPTSAEGGASRVAVDARGAFFKLPGPDSPLLSAAFERYLAISFPHVTADAGPGPGLSISAIVFTVADLDESHPQYGMDESYTLDIPNQTSRIGATVSANTVLTRCSRQS